MKAIIFFSLVFIGAVSNAADISYYTDLKLECSSDDVVISGTSEIVEQDAKNVYLTFAVKNMALSEVETVVSGSVSLNDERNTYFSDMFNFKYSFTLPVGRLKEAGEFLLEVQQTHEQGEIDNVIEMSCAYSFKTEEQSFTPATKKNLKKLPIETLAALVYYDGYGETGEEISGVTNGPEEYAQMEHYAQNISLTRDNLRSSYQRYLVSLEKAYEGLYDECWENFDLEEYAADHDIELEEGAKPEDYIESGCGFDVYLVLDKDGVFVAGAVWLTNYNGTDDYDDDDGTFYLVDWKKNVLYEHYWYN